MYILKLKISRSFVLLMIGSIQVKQADHKLALSRIWLLWSDLILRSWGWSHQDGHDAFKTPSASSYVYFQVSAAAQVWFLWPAVSFGSAYLVWNIFLCFLVFWVGIWHVVGCSFRLSDSISVCVSVKRNVNVLDFFSLTWHLFIFVVQHYKFISICIVLFC